MLTKMKDVVNQITDAALGLLALAIVAGILIGGTLPFFGSVVANLTSVINQLGEAGLAGLISLGLIAWLFAGRSA
ncbi:MAG TPA: hypothetical protein EYN60_04395 [Nitrospirales bacterium]|nr:hypothetical protein [Nitrospirales bacterium]HIA13578.1 hypothetical protein [Nitrospirales bacterium]HIB55053.1 hypothetical protein [Nitrospirales bacterium]HIC04799.1 hypothetical protein [Nitrospirales bacterium]HIN33185.1 hypothetical protein [Nitrospirales bacterium]